MNLKSAHIILLTGSNNFAHWFSNTCVEKYQKEPLVIYNTFLLYDELKKHTNSVLFMDAEIHKKPTSRVLEKMLEDGLEVPTIIFNNSPDPMYSTEPYSFTLKWVNRPLKQLATEKDYITFCKKFLDEMKDFDFSKAKSSKRISLGGHKKFELLAIGSSTGGPVALENVLIRISKDINVPVVITQHMPSSFTKTLAERLSAKSGLKVYEAEDGMELAPGCFYIAPGDYHLLFQKNGNSLVVHLDHGEEVNSCRPSVDVMFADIAKHFGGSILAVILTGMGSDGANGCQKIKELGGRVIIQDKETSVVWGMPRAVYERNSYDEILPINDIGGRINELLLGKSNI